MARHIPLLISVQPTRQMRLPDDFPAHHGQRVSRLAIPIGSFDMDAPRLVREAFAETMLGLSRPGPIHRKFMAEAGALNVDADALARNMPEILDILARAPPALEFSLTLIRGGAIEAVEEFAGFIARECQALLADSSLAWSSFVQARTAPPLGWMHHPWDGSADAAALMARCAAVCEARDLAAAAPAQPRALRASLAL